MLFQDEKDPRPPPEELNLAGSTTLSAEHLEVPEIEALNGTQEVPTAQDNSARRRVDIETGRAETGGLNTDDPKADVGMQPWLTDLRTFVSKILEWTSDRPGMRRQSQSSVQENKRRFHEGTSSVAT